MEVIMAIKNRGTVVPRNPVARSPLMKKGGVHEKSKTAKRRENNQALKSQLEDWREELEFERSLRSNSNLLHSTKSGNKCNITGLLSLF